MDLDEKGMEVKERLKYLCYVYNFNFINNSCISEEIKGSYALANNLLESIRL